MILTEFYKQRKDGVKLYRRYSDKGVYIKQLLNGVETGFIDAEAIDVEDAPYTYIETNEPIIEEETNE